MIACGHGRLFRACAFSTRTGWEIGALVKTEIKEACEGAV
jgi:hypothetical protein